MGFPSIFITNFKQKFIFPESLELFSYNDVTILYEKKIRSKMLIIDINNCLLIAHVNIGCRKKLLTMGEAIDKLMNNYASIILDLHWGFLFFINKQTDQFILYNDIYGIYPIYILKKAKDFVISNDTDGLLRIQDSVSFSTQGIFDYFLFNYTLDGRTLFKDIVQLKGGSVISGFTHLKSIEIKKVTDIAGYLSQQEFKRFDIDLATQALSQNLINDLDEDMPIVLPLSGGFDSKLILSILLNKQFQFSAYTYGFPGSADHVAAEATASQFKIPYMFIDLNTDSLPDIDNQIKNFIRNSPAVPLILDLLSYEHVKQNLSPSNIITGVMGGELIVGPVVVSEVILTRSAKTLTTSVDSYSLRSGILNDIDSIPFLDRKNYRINIEEHIAGLENYRFEPSDNYHKNVTSFLLNETYAKFFGVVFNNLVGEYNMINPFVDVVFLGILLNSEYRYTRNNLFSRNPLMHLNSRRLYPKMIQNLYEPVLFSPLDRNYMMADLLDYHRLPLTLKRYIENHLFRKNKIKPTITLNQTKIIRLLILEKLTNSPLLDMPFIQKDILKELLNKIKLDIPISVYVERKLILLLSLHYLQELYNIKGDK